MRRQGAEMIMRQVEEAETEVRMNTIVFTSNKKVTRCRDLSYEKVMGW